jgi:hypothetical protein
MDSSQAKQGKKHPVNAYGGSPTARHGRKGSWMRTDKMTRADFIPTLSWDWTMLINHAGHNHARHTRRRWKLWKRPAAQQTPRQACLEDACTKDPTGVPYPAALPT